MKGTRIKRSLLLLGIAVLLAGCSLLPVSAPSWEADFQIPLTVSSTTANEILEESPLQTDGQHYFMSETVEGSFTLGMDNLELDDISSPVTLAFPALDLGNILSDELIVTQLPIHGLVSGNDLPGGEVNFAEFELLGIKEGEMVLTAENRGDTAISFTVKLEFTTATVEIEVADLQPGESRIIEEPLDNLTIDNHAEVTIVNPQIPNPAGFAQLDLKLSSLEIKSLASIKGYSTSQVISVSTQVDLLEDDLEKINIESGTLTFSTDAISALTLTVTNLTLDGEDLVAVGGNSFSLDGKTLDKTAVLDADFNIQIDGSQLFTVPDSFNATATVAGLVLESVELSGLTVNLSDAGSQEIQIPDMELDEPLNQIRLSGASLELELTQNLGDLIYDEIYLKVTKSDSSTYNVDVEEVRDTAGAKTIVFKSSDVSTLVNDIIAGNISKMSIEGTIKSNGGVVISGDSLVEYTAKINLPFKLEGNQSIDYAADEFDFEMKVDSAELGFDAKKLINQALGGVRLEAEVQNGLPIGLDIELKLKDQNGQEIKTLTGTVLPGNTDENGLVTSARISIVSLALGQSEIERLVEATKIYVTPTLTLKVPENGAMLKPDDFIKVRALLVVKLLIDGSGIQ